MKADQDLQGLVQLLHKDVGLLRKYGFEHIPARIQQTADILECLSKDRPARMFPVQDGPDIPWDVIAPFDKQCRRQHGGQTLDRMQERGGLSVSEVLSIIEGDGEYSRYWEQAGRDVKNKTANILRLQTLVREALSAQRGTCNSCRFWDRLEGHNYGSCEHEVVRRQCEQGPFWAADDFSCKFYDPQLTATEEAS